MIPFKVTDIAFVTGGGSGIGRATCQLLAEQGATVVAADINKKSADDTLLNLPGTNHLSIQLDVSKKDEVRKAVGEVVAKYSSPPTITVNSAGVPFLGSLLDITEENCNKLFDVNIKGTVWVTQAVCQELVAVSMKGSILNLSSVMRAGHPQGSLFAASKGAVESFSSSAAKEFGPYGIRVNVVSPGATDTPMSKPYPEFIQSVIDRTPLGRIATAEEVAEVIVFLASKKASYVNGTSMYVHGGLI